MLRLNSNEKSNIRTMASFIKSDDILVQTIKRLNTGHYVYYIVCRKELGWRNVEYTIEKYSTKGQKLDTIPVDRNTGYVTTKVPASLVRYILEYDKILNSYLRHGEKIFEGA